MVTYKKDVQSTSQIITTNILTSNFLQAGCPSCHQTNNVKALKGSIQTCNSQHKIAKVNSIYFQQATPQLM